jgi:hypothetical protein
MLFAIFYKNACIGNLIPGNSHEFHHRANRSSYLQALQDMVPQLRDRAPAAEPAGRLHQGTIDGLRAVDAFRAVVPKRYGGLELPYPDIPQISRILGRGVPQPHDAWDF